MSEIVHIYYSFLVTYFKSYAMGLIYFQNKLHCATILLLLNLLNQKFVIFNPWTIHAELSPPTDT